MTDLSTTYLGLPLRTPLVASASPLTGDPTTLRALGAAGVSAVVLPSLFEEQVVHESLGVHGMLERGTDHAEAAGGYFPTLDDYNTGTYRYLRHLETAKQLLDVPVIASLNGTTPGWWTRYARMLEDAGADAVELNVYRIAADTDTPGRAVERELTTLVAEVSAELTIPLAVKLTPFYSALGSLAQEVVAAGADGLVLFNRFYQPDIDLETLTVEPRVALSTSEELRLPLRWIAILRDRVPASLAATTGVHTARDVVKAILAGADVTMLASALLRHGPAHIEAVEIGLLDWLVERGYRSVEQAKGSVSQARVADPADFERAQYLRTLTTYRRTLTS